MSQTVDDVIDTLETRERLVDELFAGDGAMMRAMLRAAPEKCCELVVTIRYERKGRESVVVQLRLDREDGSVLDAGMPLVRRSITEDEDEDTTGGGDEMA